MTGFHLASLSALWLGILTSVSPCPLATNIAAIGFVGREVTRPAAVLMSAFAYMAGRMLTYVVLAFILAAGVLAIPDVSFFLEKYANSVLGPILILTGMFVLDLLRLNLPDFDKSAVAGSLASKCGAAAPFAMGAVFALAFCPVSGALYFGSLMPLTLKFKSSLIIPVVYAVGSALPVVLASLLLSVGAKSVGETFNLMSAFESKARRATGIVFVAAGIYLSLKYSFRVI
jgi:cytochrome c-type biogenesis protein